MKTLLSTLTIVIALTSLSFAQDNNAYKETLQTMFKLSGSESAYESAITQMFSMFKQQYSSVDDATWSELEAEFNKTSLDDLVDMMVPIYQKYLTIDDLKEIIKFYETPIGKKYAMQTPLITQEAMQAGQTWGMKIGQDFTEKMKARGY